MNNYCLSAVKSHNSYVMQSFESLPSDNFLQDEYIFRKRRYSTGIIINGNVDWDKKIANFHQSKSINGYAGGMQRKYESLEENVMKYIDFYLVPAALAQLPNAVYELGVHQMRVTAQGDHIGKPAPEGIHQDGFDYVMTYCVNLCNIAGGNSILVDSKDHSNIVCDKILQPSEFLMFDDRIHAHYVSPIIPRLPGHGFRDVFVLTFKAKTK